MELLRDLCHFFVVTLLKGRNNNGENKINYLIESWRWSGKKVVNSVVSILYSNSTYIEVDDWGWVPDDTGRRDEKAKLQRDARARGADRVAT